MTVIGLGAPFAVHVDPPPVQEAVCALTAASPSDDGAVNAMVALPLPALAVPIVGTPGKVRCVTVKVPPLLRLLSPPPQPQADPMISARTRHDAGSASNTFSMQ